MTWSRTEAEEAEAEGPEDPDVHDFWCPFCEEERRQVSEACPICRIGPMEKL